MPHGLKHFGVCRFNELKQPIECRAAGRLPENPRSVIVVLFPYYVPTHGQRNIALYAVPDDYHTVAGGILERVTDVLSERYPEEKFVPFIDDSPIPEKAAARRAGLGVIGRNGLLLNPEYGGYVFTGTIVTTLDIPPSKFTETGCADCGACVKACPTSAISMDKPFDRSRCISAITQKKQPLSQWEEEQVRRGGLVWGCDICLTACPMSNPPKVSPIAAFHDSASPCLTPDNIDELLRRKAYGYRSRDVLLRNYYLLK